MLGRLRMSLDQAIKEYGRIVEEVFSDKKAFGTNGNSTYKGTKLRKTLKAMVQEVTGTEDEPMSKDLEGGGGCKT